MKIRTAIAALTLATATSITAAAEPKTLPLWPNLDESLKSKAVVDQRGTPDAPNRFIRQIEYPLLTVHLPERSARPTPAIVICPGGAYRGVAVDKEGHAVARWLNSIGIAGIVLEYRVPRPEVTRDGTPLPLQDAREALRTVRASANDWNIDPAKVGIMGFSAGGHLASTAITHPPDDPAARADFAVLGYPVITLVDQGAHVGSRNQLLGKDPDPKLLELYSNERQVTEKTPPVFMVHTEDDPVSCNNSILFFQACKEHKVPAELHLFPKGGHGYGLGPEGSPVAQWPKLCEAWLRATKVLD